MNALTTLAERCESAGADEQRALLEEAWNAVFEAPKHYRVSVQSDGTPWPGDGIGPYTEEAKEWLTANRKFHACVTASAYVDAALMFVPEGMRYHLTVDPTGGFAGAGSAMATVKTGVRQEEVYGEATTPALAILSASLRAWADRSK